MSIHSRIREIRDIYKLTQEEFGSRLGYGRAHVSMLEGGDRQPTERAISDICGVYGVNRSWLVDGEGEMLGGPQALIESVVRLLNVAGDEDRTLVTNYLQMPSAKREAFREFLSELMGIKK